MQIRFNRLHSALMIPRAIFFVLGKIPAVLILLFVGFFAFYVNDQGLDLIASFANTRFWEDLPYKLFFILFLLLWANTVWNVSRVLLGSANLAQVMQRPATGVHILEGDQPAPANYLAVCIESRYAYLLYGLYTWVPRILIFVPYLIFLAAWVKENGRFSTMPVMVAVTAIAHFMVITYRLRIAGGRYAKRARARDLPLQDLMNRLRQEVGFLQSLRDERVRIIALITAVATFLVFVYAAIAAFSNNPIVKGKPGLIILSALAFYTVITFLLHLVGKATRLPVFLLLLVLALIASRFNNNHQIELLRNPADLALLRSRNNLPDTTYFKNWLAYKRKSRVYTDSGKKNTIFLIAAEGGGIRACYWTAMVLKELQQRFPNLYRQTFAVTGASGGSVGLAFFYNYLYAHQTAFAKSGYKNLNLTKIGIDSICSADFLSRVTFGFLYPDLWQRFIPFKIRAWDRGRYLAQSFDAAFASANKDQNDECLLSQNYLSMWRDSTRYAYPAVLFNSLYVEKGAKAIIAPFKLSAQYYTDALDVLSVTKRAIPMREGMVSTARFPFVTPPGLMVFDSGQRSVNDVSENREIGFGHLIDGGGFDNKAIQTAQQTAIMIKKQLEKSGDTSFQVRIIYIGYGIEPLVPGNEIINATEPVASYEAPLGGTYELAPAVGGANAIFRWIFSAHGLTVQQDSTLDVVDFGLRTRRDSVEHILPLGWYLSPLSKRLINEDLKQKHLYPSFLKVGHLISRKS